MVAKVAIVAGLVQYASAHSWVIRVGENGHARGYEPKQGDSLLQRVVCPLGRLDLCQPPEKHGVTLTDDALRPCRGGQLSNPMARVQAGQSLKLAWMGNGHVANGQSDGTCVQIRLAPYRDDPA